MANPEGVTVSPDGTNVYVAAPGSNAVDTFARDDSTGALTQATDGTGCTVEIALTGCTTGTQLVGADALTVSPDGGDVYVTSLGSNTVTTFTRAASTGQLTQLSGTSACVINVLAVGCSLGRELGGAEGLAVSPDGTSVYARHSVRRPGRLQSQRRLGRLVPEASRAGMPCRRRGRRAACSDEGFSGASSSPSAPMAGTSTSRRSPAIPSPYSDASPER